MTDAFAMDTTIDASTTTEHHDTMPSDPENPTDAHTSTEVEDAQEGPTGIVPQKSKLHLQFADFANDPIDGLKYRLRSKSQSFYGCTASDGLINDLPEIDPTGVLQIEVWREHTQDFKTIGEIPLLPGEFNYSIVSPKLAFDISTEPHKGTPNSAASPLPPKPVSAPSQRVAPALSTEPSTQQNKASPAQSLSAKPAQGAQQKGAQVQPSSAKKKSVTKPTRNQNGNPVIAIYDTTMDWLQRKLLPSLNYWTWDDFKAGKVRAPTQGHTAVTPTSAQQNTSNASDTQNRLNALITFLEQQVCYDYGANTSAQVIKKYSQNASPAWPSKSNVSIGQCLKYVKVALNLSGYTSGIPGTALAKNSGSDWITYGFTNITNTLPKVKIKYGNAIEDVPDLVWTLPGDVIVYQKAAAPSAPGHIDIRTYHGYGSDFIWPGRGGFPDVKTYKVIGVYRKFSDVAAGVRLKAFLRIIREHEAKGYKQPYNALRFSKEGGHQTFTSYEQHPFSGLENRPAGAYQIKARTYTEDVIKPMGWGEEFGPAAQDRAAVFLLQRRGVGLAPARKTALGSILEGNIDKAVNDYKLWNEWAFLPGGGRQSQISMAELKTLFMKYTSNTP